MTEDAIVETEDIETSEPEWQTLDRNQRRVLGALIEKAKTTPDSYPLTLNALTNACNQKSNRFPQLDLEPIHIQNAIEKMRAMGAVTEVMSGRTSKFRQLGGQWMAVNGVELAVMAELLLRGAQTIGDLRGRANRMSAIASVAELRPIVQNLISRKLVVPLTEPGRGQIVTHNLYEESELQRLRDEHNNGQPVASSSSSPSSRVSSSSPVSSASTASTSSNAASLFSSSPGTPSPAMPPVPPMATLVEDLAAMRSEIDQLKSEVSRLQNEVSELNSQHE